ncbi:MAG: TolC family protein [Crocinitomicaceae bacterium]|nr:TolC family protein [Crocinitomicaceae bacterium]
MKKILLISFLFVSFLSVSQTDLSLSEAIEKALANNFQIKLIKTNLEVSETQNTWGMAGAVPTVNLNINNSNSLNDNTNNPATFFPGVVLSDNVSTQLDMTWTIFSGFGIRINKERFDQLEEQTKGNAIITIEQTIYDIIIAYYTAVTQERKLEILEEMLAFSKSKYDYFKMKSEMGLQPSIEVLEFRNQVLTDSSNYLLQQLSLSNAKRNLNLEMGETYDANYNLTDKIEFDVPKATWQELYEYMIANNQNIKNQYINMELQRLNTEQKQAAYYPVVNLNMGLTPSFGRISVFNDSIIGFNTSSLNYYANISVRYTLFNGYARQRNVEIAKLQEEIAGMQKDDLLLTLTHNLRTIFELYQTQSKVEDMALERVKNGKIFWEMAVEEYNMGGNMRLFELNDVKVRYESAVLSYYDRLLDLLRTHYDLMRITGTITQEYKISESIEGQD